MPRKPVIRTIHGQPDVNYFKPRGIPLAQLDEVVLGLDEIEAIRLADLEGLTQAEISIWMNISRATVGRILERARRKTADAITHGKALKIEGGPVQHQLKQKEGESAVCECQICLNHKNRKE